MDIQTVRQISEVAKIKMAEDEMATVAKEMAQLLDHFKSVQEIRAGETSEGEQKSGYMHGIVNTYREDEVFESDEQTKEAIRKEFTKENGNLLIAPKSLK